MSHEKVCKMIDQFVSLADEITGQLPAPSVAYKTQRALLDKFYEQLHDSLRAITGELGGEIVVLRERQLDAKMMKMLIKVYQELHAIIRELNREKPYDGAKKLVQLVLEKPSSSIIDNLDFLAKQHLLLTNVDFTAGPMLQHPEMRSLDRLKALATRTRQFMVQHPLIEPPVSAQLPPPRLQQTMTVIPDFRAGQQEVTKSEKR
jgi:hypothetical protein